jgi:ribosome biogenesis GTPase
MNPNIMIRRVPHPKIILLHKILVLAQGLVIKSTGSWYMVRREDQSVLPCKIKGKFRLRGTQVTNPVAVGDQVDFDLLPDGASGIITRIYERKNYIIRRSSNLSREAQIIAANIDLALLVITLAEPPTTTIFIDRFLASAEAYRIPCLLVINKTDLYDEEQQARMREMIHIYETVGYPCLETSVPENRNIEALRDRVRNRVCLLSGHSGVGKSALVNAMDPSLNVRIGEISDYHKMGKHTTSFPEMYALSFGGYIIDTPGIKGFGMVDMDKEEIFHFFPEIFRLSHQCQFYNCLHVSEPMCAVRKAVDDDIISRSRYLSYLSILEEDEQKYRR